MNLHRIDINEVEASQVRPLRTKVLRPWFEEGELLEYEGEDGADDHHFTAVDTEEERIVGVVSYIFEPLPIDGESAEIRLRGMAIVEELRGQGIGSHLLMTSLPKLALYHPGARVWAAARIKACDFYLRHGFEPVGPRFEMSRVGPHQRVVRSLPMVLA